MTDPDCSQGPYIDYVDLTKSDDRLTAEREAHGLFYSYLSDPNSIEERIVQLARGDISWLNRLRTSRRKQTDDSDGGGNDKITACLDHYVRMFESEFESVRTSFNLAMEKKYALRSTNIARQNLLISTAKSAMSGSSSAITILSRDMKISREMICESMYNIVQILKVMFGISKNVSDSGKYDPKYGSGKDRILDNYWDELIERYEEEGYRDEDEEADDSPSNLIHMRQQRSPNHTNTNELTSKVKFTRIRKMSRDDEITLDLLLKYDPLAGLEKTNADIREVVDIRECLVSVVRNESIGLPAVNSAFGSVTSVSLLLKTLNDSLDADASGDANFVSGTAKKKKEKKKIRDEAAETKTTITTTNNSNKSIPPNSKKFVDFVVEELEWTKVQSSILTNRLRFLYKHIYILTEDVYMRIFRLRSTSSYSARMRLRVAQLYTNPPFFDLDFVREQISILVGKLREVSSNNELMSDNKYGKNILPSSSSIRPKELEDNNDSNICKYLQMTFSPSSSSSSSRPDPQYTLKSKAREEATPHMRDIIFLKNEFGSIAPPTKFISSVVALKLFSRLGNNTSGTVEGNLKCMRLSFIDPCVNWYELMMGGAHLLSRHDLLAETIPSISPFVCCEIILTPISLFVEIHNVISFACANSSFALWYQLSCSNPPKSPITSSSIYKMIQSISTVASKSSSRITIDKQGKLVFPADLSCKTNTDKYPMWRDQKLFRAGDLTSLMLYATESMRLFNSCIRMSKSVFKGIEGEDKSLHLVDNNFSLHSISPIQIYLSIACLIFPVIFSSQMIMHHFGEDKLDGMPFDARPRGALGIRLSNLYKEILSKM